MEDEKNDELEELEEKIEKYEDKLEHHNLLD